MAFPLSPGINVSEIDLSTIVPSLATSTGAFAGKFVWGPANEVITITNENSLRALMGKPSDSNFVDWFTAANFLAYSNNLKLVRAISEDESLNATANGDGFFIPNKSFYEANCNSGEANTSGAFAARYPGALGNGIFVSLCPNANAYSQNVSSATSYYTSADLPSKNYPGNTTITVAGDLTNYIKVGDLVGLQPPGNSLTDFASVTAVDSGTITINKGFSYNVATGAAVHRRWKYYNQFTGAPGTSEYAAKKEGSSDEMHIIVIDSKGNFAIKNTILEKYAFVSKASDAQSYDGSSNYYKELINQRSRYLWFLDHPELANTDSWGHSANGTTFTEETSLDAQNYYVTLGGGVDGTITESYLVKAYDKFRDTSTTDVSLMMSSDASSTVLTSVLSNVIEERKDCVLFVSPRKDSVVYNPDLETEAVIKDREDYGIGSSYVVMDSGWKYIFDKYNNVYRWVPLNGDIAGLCARTDLQRDPWFSPAGLNRGQIKNVIKLAWNPNQGQRDSIYLKNINPVVTFPGEGTLLFGDKTMQDKPSAFDRINVRRLFIVLEKMISKAARSTLFEFNDQFTRSQFRNLVEPFLRDVQGRRGITDFRVVCDETNNTPEVIDRNEFVGDIYIKPARSINYIQLNFIAVRTDVNFDEIVGRF